MLEEAERSEEEPGAGLSETFAEESTLQRWKKEFSEQLPLMVGKLEQITAEVGIVNFASNYTKNSSCVIFRRRFPRTTTLAFELAF
ncbi:MAG: hypothetical protein LBP21_03050 [Synergistaceae bacterium]|nr:hypothetical protein [Synergistaceae bacterium]